MATLSEVNTEGGHSLDEVLDYSHLISAVTNLRETASALTPMISSVDGRVRKIFMINSTSQGGGVAEMMPRLVQVMRDLGIETHWLVLTPAHEHIPAFFDFTKRLHNLIHGFGHVNISDEEAATYEAVTSAAGSILAKKLQRGDVVILHDPQPLGMSKTLRHLLGDDIYIVFRSHIGLDCVTPETSTAWDFLKPFAEVANTSVFSAPEYIPAFLAGYSTVIPPGIDPLSHKNRDMTPVKLTGVLCNAGLVDERHPVMTPPWADQAKRLQPDGSFAVATTPEEIGLQFRPTITQVSRWDALKGWMPLMKAFVQLKRQRQLFKAEVDSGSWHDRRHARRLELCRLIMAGPDPASILDDPEGKQVLDELCKAYCALEPDYQRDIVLLTLPMVCRKSNALMVNAIQRCSQVVVQNSHREGFGLTVSEAMWKGLPVLGTHACGIRQQILDGVHGRLVRDPNNVEEIASVLNAMMSDDRGRENQGLKAQSRVLKEFTVFAQVSKWLVCIHHLVKGYVPVYSSDLTS